jgi:hypothetical protein
MEDSIMSSELEKVFHGTLTEEEGEINLAQLRTICDLTPDHIVELVEEGILEPWANQNTNGISPLPLSKG